MELMHYCEGKRGEDLATSLLRYLLQSSSPIRTAFVDFVAEHSQKALTSRNYFGFLDQARTISDDSRIGRMDVRFEIDNAVIGIEVKLLAGFQDEQPGKYLASTREHAKVLSGARGAEMKTLIGVLAPRFMKAAAEARIADQALIGIAFFLPWEDLLERFETTRVDPVAAFLVGELSAFVRTGIGVRKDFHSLYSRLQADISASEDVDAAHADVTRWLEPVFTLENAKSSRWPNRARGRYCGYWCLGGYPDEDKAWYGFVSSQVTGDNDGRSRFVLASSFDIPSLQPPVFKRLGRIDNDGFKGMHCWAIEYEATWGDRARWDQELTGFREVAKGLL